MRESAAAGIIVLELKGNNVATAIGIADKSEARPIAQR